MQTLSTTLSGRYALRRAIIVFHGSRSREEEVSIDALAECIDQRASDMLERCKHTDVSIWPDSLGALEGYPTWLCFKRGFYVARADESVPPLTIAELNRLCEDAGFVIVYVGTGEEAGEKDDWTVMSAFVAMRTPRMAPPMPVASAATAAEERPYKTKPRLDQLEERCAELEERCTKAEEYSAGLEERLNDLIGYVAKTWMAILTQVFPLESEPVVEESASTSTREDANIPSPSPCADI